MCRGRGSNPQGFLRRILSPLRLPIPPPRLPTRYFTFLVLSIQLFGIIPVNSTIYSVIVSNQLLITFKILFFRHYNLITLKIIFSGLARDNMRNSARCYVKNKRGIFKSGFFGKDMTRLYKCLQGVNRYVQGK